MRKINVKGAVILAFFVLCICAHAAPIVGDANIRTKVLPNGLRIIVKEERTWPIVAMGMYVRGGSGYEGPNQVGAAHLVEHLLFETPGTDARPRIAEYIESIGGNISAFTSRDSTNVDITITSTYIETALDTLITTVFDAEFSDDSILHEQSVVTQEIAQREARGTLEMDQLLWELSFGTHPYGRPIGGTADDIAKLSIEQIKAYYDMFYVPNNVSLVLVGRVDADWLFDRVETLTSGYKAAPLAFSPPVLAPPQTEISKDIRQRDSQTTVLSFAWRAAAINDKTAVCATDLLYTILGHGASGRLNRRLVDEDGYALAVDLNYLTQRWPGLFVITAAVRDQNELALRKAIIEEVQRLVDEKVSDAELDRAKLQIRTEYAFANESYSGQVMSLGFYEAIDDYKFAVEYADRVNAITPEDIQAAARDIFRPDSYSLVILRRLQDAPPAQEVRHTCPVAS